MSTPVSAFIYLRLSVEESNKGESSSISNQREIIHEFCRSRSIMIVREFVDDGFSGGNFQRPGFISMLEQLERTKVRMVITKDLSRLGRDMTESSMYAERYFPEHGIHYLTVSDGFDSQNDNVLAPFQFAMNDVYIRDASRKIKTVMNQKRRAGQYCACPPYGYKKEARQKGHLIPDENTAPIVRKIFELSASGMSTRAITNYLNDNLVMAPLKYRVECRDNFSDRGAARASEKWNYATVKRILQNRVYLGHTLLGKSKKVSVKADKKIALPVEDWCITEYTHEPLVTEELFRQAAESLKRHTKTYYDDPFEKNGGYRKSIFRGLVFCASCGAAMSSGGTVYKNERLSYWYLSCNNIPKRSMHHCENGARIKYADLNEIVKNELNTLIALTDEEVNDVIQHAIERDNNGNTKERIKSRIKAAQKELDENDKIIEKLYRDNITGKISDERLNTMIDSIEKKTKSLNAMITDLLSQEQAAANDGDKYRQFFTIVKNYSHIETLTAEILNAFIEKITVSKKVQTSAGEEQLIEIYYKFIGKLQL